MEHDEGQRSRWRLARVESLIPGNDGRIHTINIRTDQVVPFRGWRRRSLSQLNLNEYIRTLTFDSEISEICD